MNPNAYAFKPEEEPAISLHREYTNNLCPIAPKTDSTMYYEDGDGDKMMKEACGIMTTVDYKYNRV